MVERITFRNQVSPHRFSPISMWAPLLPAPPNAHLPRSLGFLDCALCTADISAACTWKGYSSGNITGFLPACHGFWICSERNKAYPREMDGKNQENQEPGPSGAWTASPPLTRGWFISGAGLTLSRFFMLRRKTRRSALGSPPRKEKYTDLPCMELSCLSG